MELKECYQQLGGNYDDVLRRFGGQQDRLRKFLLKLMEDDSYPTLCAALKSGDEESAFRAAHSLKGICLNLDLGMLFQSSSALTELLREGLQNGLDRDQVEQLFANVTEDYQKTIGLIQSLQNN